MLLSKLCVWHEPVPPYVVAAGANHAATTPRPSANTSNSSAMNRHSATLPSRPLPARTQPEQSIYDRQPAHTLANDTVTYRPTHALQTDAGTYQPAHTLQTDAGTYRPLPALTTNSVKYPAQTLASPSGRPGDRLDNTSGTQAAVEHHGARAKGGWDVEKTGFKMDIILQ